MKKLLFSIIALLSPIAFADQTITCNIEQPCIWLTADPHNPNEVLGYCVRGIAGDQTRLLLQRDDGHGQILAPSELNVEVASKDRFAAKSADGKIDLNVDRYSDFLAGELVIRTEKAPGGLGFFVACSVK